MPALNELNKLNESNSLRFIAFSDNANARSITCKQAYVMLAYALF